MDSRVPVVLSWDGTPNLRLEAFVGMPSRKPDPYLRLHSGTEPSRKFSSFVVLLEWEKALVVADESEDEQVETS